MGNRCWGTGQAEEGPTVTPKNTIRDPFVMEDFEIQVKGQTAHCCFDVQEPSVGLLELGGL